MARPAPPGQRVRPALGLPDPPALREPVRLDRQATMDPPDRQARQARPGQKVIPVLPELVEVRLGLPVTQV